jgi:putative spermidine/putrescine transport system ATP-binding protein
MEPSRRTAGNEGCLKDLTMAYLETIGLTKRFGRTTAVDNVSLSIEKGELVSLLGPSGCGKTTTLRLVAGFEKPTEGAIHLDSEDITTLPDNKRNMGMVFQSYALFPNLNVADNVGFGLDVRRVSKEERDQRVAEMLDLVGLNGLENRFVHQISGGQQQRVALARALAIQPRVLLLDEPLSALDAKVRLSLRGEIRRIQQELGITSIYVTHDQEESLVLSDRVVVMNLGRIEQVGTPIEIYENPLTPFVATFVGTVNVFHGRVIDVQKGLVQIENQVIQLDAETARNLHDSGTSQPTLAIRPEKIGLRPEEGGNHLVGRVDSVSFLGALVQITACVGDQPLMAVLFNEVSTRQLKAGHALDVYFPPEAVKILSEEP